MDAVQDWHRTDLMQNIKDAGQDGGRARWARCIEDRMSSGQDRCRTVWMQAMKNTDRMKWMEHVSNVGPQ